MASSMSKELHQFLNFLAIPVAVTMTFELTSQRHFLLFSVLAVGSALLNGTAAFVATCWQSLCVAALISLTISLCAPSLFNPNIAFLLFVAVLCLLVFYKRSTQWAKGIYRTVDLKRDFVALLSISFMSLGSPRGDKSKFALILAEDNEGWIRAPLNLIRDSQIDLSPNLGTTSIQYFVNFSLSSFTRIFGDSPGLGNSDQVNAIHIVATSWSFLWVSGILLVLVLTSDLTTRVIKQRSSILLYSAVGIFQIGFFRAALLSGHYAQFLLNVVVSALIISLVEMVSVRDQRRPWGQALVAIAVALAMVGSYNPWIAISLGALFLIVNDFFSISLISRTVRSRYLPVIGLFSLGGLLVVYLQLSSRYGMLDDGGGIWVVGSESIWVGGIMIILVSTALLLQNDSSRSYFSSVNSRRNLTINEFFAICTVIFGVFLVSEDHNSRQWLSLLLLIGMLATRQNFSELREKCSRIASDKTYFPTFLLCVGAYIFVLYVWLASRFVGPIYEPMYAAHKSLLTFAGQFYWIVICLLFVEASRAKLELILRNVVVGLLFLMVCGLFPVVRGDKTEAPIDPVSNLGGDWWVSPMIQSYSANQNAFVACVNGDWTVDEISVYNCNRFSSSLSVDGELANSFRYLAWKQKETYSTLRDLVALIPPDRSVVVISNGLMTPETRALFDMRTGTLEFIEVAS